MSILYTVFRRPDSPNWWVSFSLPEIGLIRESLRTKDKATADEKAASVYYGYKAKIEHRLPVKNDNFQHVMPKFHAFLKERLEQRKLTLTRYTQHKKFIDSYFMEYFHKKTPQFLNTHEINKFIEWRCNYWITGPGKEQTHRTIHRGNRVFQRRIPANLKVYPTSSTLEGNNAAMHQLVRWLHDNGYIRNLITWERPPVATSARPGFKSDEIALYMNQAQKDITAEDLNIRERYDRVLIWAFSGFMINTGLRPTEALRLRWKDLVGWSCDALSDFKILVHAKKKHRTAIPFPAAGSDLATMWDLFDGYFGHVPSPDDFIFCSTSRKKSDYTNVLMNRILKKTGLQTDYRGVRRSSYSFRHYYITSQLERGLDAYLIAKACGTSVDQIRKHYDHTSLEQYKDKLIPKSMRL
ncbi:tyrosine-type recombinase/integrase [Acetobacter conturbans]|uniref:Tyrosine-type recombinase/integrase n=1 Tax=Acetobacter conturbans TaxID=1737472 RepID=A0ABX0K1X1_9PROT|nr:site-specific integrase [Acetobacter conturbans]NHN89636.1 tyrosine-type recombinase/integrase [Acetobacter conturbans]